MGFVTFKLPGDDMSMSGGEIQLVCQRLAARTSAIGGDAGADAYQAALKIEKGVHDGAPIDFSDAEARQFIEVVDVLRSERRLICGAMGVRNALNDRLAAGWESASARERLRVAHLLASDTYPTGFRNREPTSSSLPSK